jgi:type II secretory pathway pseudopilin PulG
MSRDGGESLIEILITVLILGVTVTGLVEGLTVGVIGSDSHRRLSDVEVVARAYGEQLVDQASNQPTTSLASAAAVGDTSISVSSATGFPAGTAFTAAVDGEVVQVKAFSAGATSWALVAPLAEPHPSGSSVTKYLFYNDAGSGSCPTAATFALTSFIAPATVATVGTINVPQVTGIEYFDANGNAISAGSCATYWSANGMPCSLFASTDTSHETQCDIDVVRLTISVSSTVSGSRGASTTTRVLLRRGNA